MQGRQCWCSTGLRFCRRLFALVQRLEEVESKVRVLQLVSVSIEALGDAAGPLLGSVAGALPMVSVYWLAAMDRGYTS